MSPASGCSAVPSLKKNEKTSGWVDAATARGTTADVETLAGLTTLAGVATLTDGRTAAAARATPGDASDSGRSIVDAGFDRTPVPWLPRTLSDVRFAAGRSDTDARPALPVLSSVSACATAVPVASAAPTPSVSAPAPSQPYGCRLRRLWRARPLPPRLPTLIRPEFRATAVPIRRSRSDEYQSDSPQFDHTSAQSARIPCTPRNSGDLIP